MTTTLADSHERRLERLEEALLEVAAAVAVLNTKIDGLVSSLQERTPVTKWTLPLAVGIIGILSGASGSSVWSVIAKMLGG